MGPFLQIHELFIKLYLSVTWYYWLSKAESKEKDDGWVTFQLNQVQIPSAGLLTHRPVTQYLIVSRVADAHKLPKHSTIIEHNGLFRVYCTFKATNDVRVSNN